MDHNPTTYISPSGRSLSSPYRIKPILNTDLQTQRGAWELLASASFDSVAKIISKFNTLGGYYYHGYNQSFLGTGKVLSPISRRHLMLLFTLPRKPTLAIKVHLINWANDVMRVLSLFSHWPVFCKDVFHLFQIIHGRACFQKCFVRFLGKKLIWMKLLFSFLSLTLCSPINGMIRAS